MLRKSAYIYHNTLGRPGPHTPHSPAWVGVLTAGNLPATSEHSYIYHIWPSLVCTGCSYQKHHHLVQQEWLKAKPSVAAGSEKSVKSTIIPLRCLLVKVDFPAICKMPVRKQMISRFYFQGFKKSRLTWTPCSSSSLPPVPGRPRRDGGGERPSNSRTTWQSSAWTFNVTEWNCQALPS